MWTPDIYEVFAGSFTITTIILVVLILGRRTTLKWSLERLIFWPPRLRTTVVDPQSAISFSCYATELSGRLDFVRNANEGDSHNAVLTFEQNERRVSDSELEKMRVRVREKTEDETVIVADVPLIPETGSLIELIRVEELNSEITSRSVPAKQDAYLEVECLIAGAEVKGDIKQRQSLGLRNLRYSWNVYFKSSGHHQLLFSFRVIDIQTGEESVRDLGAINHEVHVGRMFHLTGRQLVNIAWICAGIAGVFTILKVLAELGVIGHGLKS